MSAPLSRHDTLRLAVLSESILAPLAGALAPALVSAALSSATSAIWRALTGAVWAALSRMTSTLEVDNHDEVYAAIMEWLHAQPAMSSRAHVKLTTRYLPGVEAMQTVLTPVLGHHVIWYDGAPVWMRRSRAALPAAPPDNYAYFGHAYESITFWAMGRSRKLLERLVAEAIAATTLKARGQTQVYVRSHHAWKKQREPLAQRPLDSIFLQAGLKEDLLRDIAEFLAAGPWYQSRGVPYRRGYLLHGPPGTGKTSIVTALANHFRLNIALVNLGATGPCSQTEMLDIFEEAPLKHCLILMEDLAEAQGGATAHPQLAALLTAMDGAIGDAGRLLFVTTNVANKLSDAIVRPGRIDRIFHLGFSDRQQRRAMFEHFYHDLHSPEVGALAEAFARALDGRETSPADIQDVILRHKGDPAEALRHVQNGGGTRESQGVREE